MEAKKKDSRTIQIKLPEKGKKQSHDDLLSELVLPMSEVLSEADLKNIESRVVIVEDDGEKGKDHHGEDDGDELIKKEFESIDDVPKSDFFDVRENEKAQTFGVIESMVEVVEDDHENEFERASVRAQRLSMHAQKFADEIRSVMRKSSQLVKTNGESETEIVQDEETLEEAQAEAEAEAEAEAGDEAEAEAANADEPDEVVRQSTITIVSIPDVATHEVPIETEPAEDPKKKTSSSDLRTSIAPRISSDAARARGSRTSRQVSIYYDYETNIVQSEDDLMDFFDLDKQDKFVLPDEFEREGEEEEVVSAVEEEPEELDREPYYQKYDDCLQKISINRTKNNIFQKKVTMYLKRRKVENFLKDVEPPLDQINKYNQKLNAYEEVLDQSSMQRETITEELDTLKNKRDYDCAKLTKLFKAMQSREGNIGYGLIYTKTGNSIPEKLVERLIRRQKLQMEQVSMMRLKYIKLKGMVQEKLDAIDNIDNLENNLHLADYEQLKVENRIYADKIEERDEDLTRLRAKCQNTIQILAHIREKSAAFESDIADLTEELENSKMLAESKRSELADLKRQRDRYRNLTATIRTESGLLIEPNLLRDMEASQTDIEKLGEELINCQEEVNFKTAQIRNLRKNIERIAEIMSKRKAGKYKSKMESSMSVSNRSETLKLSVDEEEPTSTIIYSRRPTLIMPYIQSRSFNDVLKIKPNPRTCTRKRR